MSASRRIFLHALFATCGAGFTAACTDVRPSTSTATAAELGSGVAYPSSAVYDARAGVLLVASYTNGSIQRVAITGGMRSTSSPVLPLDGREHVLRIRLDAQRQRIWVLASDAVYVYDYVNSRLTHRIAIDALAQHSSDHCLPDMALDRFGNAFVSSATQTLLTRIDAESLELTQRELQLDSDQDKDFGFSALAFVGRSDTLYAASASTGALWRIDPAQNRAIKMDISQPVFGACALQATSSGRPDSASGADLVLYVAGGFHDGVKRIELSKTDLPYRVTTLQTARPLIAPTDFVAVNSQLLIVSSQLSRHPDFNGDGEMRAPFTLVPIVKP